MVEVADLRSAGPEVGGRIPGGSDAVLVVLTVGGTVASCAAYTERDRRCIRFMFMQSLFVRLRRTHMLYRPHNQYKQYH